MSRPGRSLRGRLLLAFVGLSVGVLLVAALLTIALTRATARDAALDDLRETADAVEQQGAEALAFTAQQAEQQREEGEEPLTARQVAARTLVQIRRILRLADARMVVLGPEGALVDLFAVTTPPSTDAAGSLDPTDPGAGAFELPGEIEFDDLDTAALLDGTTQEGSVGSTVFVATPLDFGAIDPNVPVLVLTKEVTTDAGRAAPFFLIAAAVTLGAAVVVSLLLARRLTRPLAAVERTARAIADGDLSARVEAGPGVHDEIARLATTIDDMAEQLERSRALDRTFLLSVSHDLRTPLTSIQGYAEAIADGTVDPGHRAQAIGVIATEAKRLERLVGDLLDLARLDAHQFSLHPVPLDAADVVERAARAFEPAAADAGVALEVDVAEPLPGETDGDRLGQIVANLVENGLRYAATSVSVRAERAGDDPARSGSRSATTVPGSIPTTCPASSIASTRPGAPADVRSGRASASRSSTSSSARWTGPLRSVARRPGPHSSSCSPSSNPATRTCAGSSELGERLARLGQLVDRRRRRPLVPGHGHRRPGLDLAPDVAEGDDAAWTLGDAGQHPDVPSVGLKSGTAGRALAVKPEPPQQPIHVAPAVDARDQLLAEEAALRERHRVPLEQGLLGNGLLVEVEALAWDSGTDARGFRGSGVDRDRSRSHERSANLVDFRRRRHEVDALPAERVDPDHPRAPLRPRSMRVRRGRQLRPPGIPRHARRGRTTERQHRELGRTLLHVGVDANAETLQRLRQPAAEPLLGEEPGVGAHA